MNICGERKVSFRGAKNFHRETKTDPQGYKLRPSRPRKAFVNFN